MATKTNFTIKRAKKLNLKGFKEVLLNIHTEPIETQPIMLDQFIKDWKGKSEQIDDMLIIGVRFK